MCMVLVGLECVEGYVEPATDVLERGPEVGRYPVGHHLPPVLRGQDNVGVEPVDHMPTVPPIIW